MLGAERLLADRQRPLVERPRAGEVALVLKQAGEVVEARGGRGMLGAERLLADRQRPLEERPGRCIGRERPLPVLAEPIKRYAAAVSAPAGGGSGPPTRSSASASSRRARGQALGSLYTSRG